ncbi:hypothetical protein CC1G_07654 [Coprinopsis cinerea okayama7|uniref:Uncharacterized protein n=1 Tax=Coprinopsis cinerea (strain Okayama-7 / 130 / ATCC MYA-4618 / FGSC 9003) TaxID=240176 RepID=A8NC50_COPC7|nr:hypothetical protein CC1G_07654 [Coprinopsis cinerea okayama7\|eukprot:XP_001832394.2 hypothetical protein CC1G_07654 [Coprinopsis cinerea okayama7\
MKYIAASIGISMLYETAKMARPLWRTYRYRKDLRFTLSHTRGCHRTFTLSHEDGELEFQCQEF